MNKKAIIIVGVIVVAVLIFVWYKKRSSSTTTNPTSTTVNPVTGQTSTGYVAAGQPVPQPVIDWINQHPTTGRTNAINSMPQWTLTDLNNLFTAVTQYFNVGRDIRTNAALNSAINTFVNKYGIVWS